MARQARQSRPQVVCILADNSGSMQGEKARAATDGIREMVMECQTRGPQGAERSYFKLLLIRFSNDAQIDPNCDMTPVRHLDSQTIEIRGDGGQTNITAALQLALDRLKPYMQGLQAHPEHAEHPLPLVMLFSDGEHNVGPAPQAVAAELKSLKLDGDPVVVVSAGVAVGGSQPDEATLREIASLECYLPVTAADMLTTFICKVGSLGLSSAVDIAKKIKEEISE
jgi:uncharacterized protein YegL